MCVCDWKGLLDQPVERVRQRIPANLVLSTTNNEDPLLLECIPVLQGRDAVNVEGMEAITNLFVQKSFDLREVVISISFANLQNILHDEHRWLHVLDRLDHLPENISPWVSKY